MQQDPAIVEFKKDVWAQLSSEYYYIENFKK